MTSHSNDSRQKMTSFTFSRFKKKWFPNESLSLGALSSRATRKRFLLQPKGALWAFVLFQWHRWERGWGDGGWRAHQSQGVIVTSLLRTKRGAEGIICEFCQLKVFVKSVNSVIISNVLNVHLKSDVKTWVEAWVKNPWLCQNIFQTLECTTVPWLV